MFVNDFTKITEEKYMSGLDTVSKLADKLALRSAKKFNKEQIPELPAAVPVSMRGEKFVAGFASRDITPADLLTHTYWMAGYNIAKSITGYLDPLTVNAMWLGTGDEGGIMLVSCDLIGLTGYDVNVVRDMLGDFTRLTGCKNITISCTHTHAGIDTMGYWGVLPKTGKDKVFQDTVLHTIADLCKEAYENRKDGRLYYGCVEAPELVDRWRQPYFTNDRLHRFRFVPDDGSTETWYLNFGAHPNTMGGKNRMLSADYPCYMRREINKAQKTNVLFSVSTIGATDIGKVADNNYKRAVLGGEALGRKALAIKDLCELRPEITTAKQEFVMPIDNKVLAVANYARIFNTRKCKADSELGIGFISEISYFNIGGVQILTMPGEMFSELVYPGGYCDKETSATGEGADINPTPLTEIMEDENLIIFGVTNDMAGYGLAPNDFVLHPTQPFLSRGTDRFGRNHYHETNSCGIKTGETIAGAVKKIKTSLG